MSAGAVGGAVRPGGSAVGGARKIRLAVAALLLFGCTQGPEMESEGHSSMFRGGPNHSGVYAGESVGGFAGVRWRLDTDGAVRSSPTVADGVVYVGSTDGRLYALDAGTGEEVWVFDAGSPIVSTAAVGGGLVFFGDRKGVFRALEGVDGSLRWQFATGPDRPLPWGNEGWDYFTSSPVLVGDRVVLGGGDGWLYALDAGSGQELWRYETDGRIRSSPAAADGVAFVGSMDGSLHAVSMESGARVWRFDTEGRSLDSAEAGFDRRSIQSSPAVVDGLVVFGSRDGHVYGLEAASGALRWRFDHEVSWCITSPAVEGGVVFAGSSDGLFAQALDAESGTELWRTPMDSRVFASPAVADGTVLFADHSGLLRALDRGTGEELWRFLTDGAIQSSPAVAGGVVFVGSDDGRVYAVQATAGASSHRAMYADPDGAAALGTFDPLKEHLARAGFRSLSPEGLSDFMSARVSDGEPSVVVFATMEVPESVAPVPGDTVLFRRYLEAGGRVVWMGYPPSSLVRDAESGRIVALDMDRTSAVLGVDHGTVTGDEYATWATAEGRRWGLPAAWTDMLAVDPTGISVVLAEDERGRAAAWVQRYSGPEGGEFVRLWGRLAAMDPWAVQRVAEFHLGR